jgi:hypothetical protein
MLYTVYHKRHDVPFTSREAHASQRHNFPAAKPQSRATFGSRYACDMFIVGADLSDWRDGNFNLISEYMKPIPR